MALFQIEAADVDGVYRIRLQGEFDLAAFPHAERALADAIQTHQQIKVDLRELTFIDSSGCRALVTAAQQARASATAFEIIPGPRTVQRVFEITKLDEYLPFRYADNDSLDASVAEDSISE